MEDCGRFLIKHQKYTFEEYSTLLTRIEACSNSRPLSPQNEDPQDLTALTPKHFLEGGPLLAPPEVDTAFNQYHNPMAEIKASTLNGY